MDYIKTSNSVKDCKLQKENIKKSANVIISDDGMSVEDLVNGYLALKAEYLKTKEENLKLQSENLLLFNKLNNNQEILVKKINKLENSVATLISNTNNE